MKKLVFMLMAALSVALTSCSWLDSKPIEPDIIGTGNVQYDAVEGIWFTEIDSIRYIVTRVTIPNTNQRLAGPIQEIAPVEGMYVTLFTSPRMKGTQAVAGRQSMWQIEDIYYVNYSIGMIAILIPLLICLIGFIFCYKSDQELSKKLRHANSET